MERLESKHFEKAITKVANGNKAMFDSLHSEVSGDKLEALKAKAYSIIIDPPASLQAELASRTDRATMVDLASESIVRGRN